jgi:hypothetical protein
MALQATSGLRIKKLINQPTSCSRVLRENPKVPQLVWNYLHVIKSEGSFPHSQQPAICPYAEPDKFIPHPPNTFP